MIDTSNGAAHASKSELEESNEDERTCARDIGIMSCNRRSGWTRAEYLTTSILKFTIRRSLLEGSSRVNTVNQNDHESRVCHLQDTARENTNHE